MLLWHQKLSFDTPEWFPRAELPYFPPNQRKLPNISEYLGRTLLVTFDLVLIQQLVAPFHDPIFSRNVSTSNVYIKNLKVSNKLTMHSLLWFIFSRCWCVVLMWQPHQTIMHKEKPYIIAHVFTRWKLSMNHLLFTLLFKPRQTTTQLVNSTFSVNKDSILLWYYFGWFSKLDRREIQVLCPRDHFVGFDRVSRHGPVSTHCSLCE